MKLINKFVLAFVLLVMQVAVTHAATKVTYFHANAQGSVIAATDEQGALLWQEGYEPYGQRVLNETTSEKMSYAGHSDDKASGLVYMGARYYDPTVGRFLSVDPAGIDPVNSFTVNRYLYGNANPFRFIDPDGRDSQQAEWAALDGTSPPSASLTQGAEAVSNGAAEVGKAIDDTATDPLTYVPIGGILGKFGTLVGFGKIANKTRTLPDLPALDSTGKVHGILPSIKDLGRYEKDDLVRLRDELKLSVQKRIEVTVKKGSDFGHAERQGAEQRLLKSLEKHLEDR